MELDSRSGWQGKGTLEELMRERIRAMIESIIDEELEGALGRHARDGWAWFGFVIGTANVPVG
jgi:hypothetical protein